MVILIARAALLDHWPFGRRAVTLAVIGWSKTTKVTASDFRHHLSSEYNPPGCTCSAPPSHLVTLTPQPPPTPRRLLHAPLVRACLLGTPPQKPTKSQPVLKRVAIFHRKIDSRLIKLPVQFFSSFSTRPKHRSQLTYNHRLQRAYLHPAARHHEIWNHAKTREAKPVISHQGPKNT